LTAKLYRGDCLEVMRGLAPDSVHAIVTDPPAGIAFMGKDWDSDKGGRDQWVAWMQGVAEEAMRVLKPGGHALVWALPRTSHWTATAWENAGFEVRDRVAHVFGSGFPKSLDVSRAIDKAAGAERLRSSVRKLDTTAEARLTAHNAHPAELLRSST
jgi:tRNA G10  N-methylase Trm11